MHGWNPPAPPAPTEAGGHLLVSVGGGPWEAATASDPIALVLPELLRPDQMQHVDFAVWNPTGTEVGLDVTATTPSGLAITPPAIVVDAPDRVGAHSIANGTVTVLTPPWTDQDWMGTRIDVPIMIRGTSDGLGPAGGLAQTGTDPAGALGLGTALLAAGAITLIAMRRRTAKQERAGARS